MQRLIVSLAASACLVALLGTPEPAHAAFVTFVSGSGDDVNDCTSLATPCRQIGGNDGALSKTTEGGIVHVLPGDYGSFGVTESVDIIADSGQVSIYD